MFIPAASNGDLFTCKSKPALEVQLCINTKCNEGKCEEEPEDLHLLVYAGRGFGKTRFAPAEKSCKKIACDREPAANSGIANTGMPAIFIDDCEQGLHGNF